MYFFTWEKNAWDSNGNFTTFKTLTFCSQSCLIFSKPKLYKSQWISVKFYILLYFIINRRSCAHAWVSGRLLDGMDSAWQLLSGFELRVWVWPSHGVFLIFFNFFMNLYNTVKAMKHIPLFWFLDLLSYTVANLKLSLPLFCIFFPIIGIGYSWESESV